MELQNLILYGTKRKKRPWLITLQLLALCLIVLHTDSATITGWCSPDSYNHRRPGQLTEEYNSQVRGADHQSEGIKLRLERRPNIASITAPDRGDILRAALYKDAQRRERATERILMRQAEAGGSSIMRRRRRRLMAGGANSDAKAAAASTASLRVISGSSVGAGEYFVSIGVGTPAQRVYLIADTGSDLTWVKCGDGPSASSSSPSSTNGTFRPEGSSTYSPVSCLSKECAAWFFPPTCEGLSRRCKFTYSYTDQSYAAGALAYEAVELAPSASAATVLLGCGDDYAGANFEKAGGVVGLGQGAFSLASQLASQKFTYCLADFFSSISGLLAFGEVAFSAPPALQYTPLVPNPALPSYYYVAVEAVSVAGAPVAGIPSGTWSVDPRTGNGGTVLDSGTTLAQFSQPAYDAIRAAFQRSIPLAPFSLAADVGLDLCYNVSGLPSPPRFPSFSILLRGGLLLDPPQENYFTDVSPGVKCLAMQGVAPPGFSVIGNLLQQNYHIEFDRLHSRIGFAPADCSKLH